MYTITANGVSLFSSSDRELAGRVFRLYKSLYAWASVRVMKKASR
jgi:hypothetical protein